MLAGFGETVQEPPTAPVCVAVQVWLVPPPVPLQFQLALLPAAGNAGLEELLPAEQYEEPAGQSEALGA